MRPIRVLVADDHTIVRQGLVSLLASSGECEVVAEAADGIEAVEQALRTRPDVAVLDISMPRLSGLEAVRRIHHELPQTRILVLTVHDEEEYVVHLVRAGASGYLVKDTATSDLLAAVRALRAGQAYFGPQAAKVLAEQYRHPEGTADPYGTLTTREREVFHLVVEGRTTKEIAHALGISAKTADNHRTRLMEKLGVHNTAELVRYAAKKGLLG
jgi:DNA-binding NarL/FixJ family response regulator